MPEDKIVDFVGYGSTVDEAIDAASKEAIATWKPAGSDDQATVNINNLRLLFGGIVGHVGTRVASVSLATPVALQTLAGKAALTLKLEAHPDELYADLMPPVRRPQPHKVALILTVTNTGSSDYGGTSPDTAVTRFSILKNRTTIWQYPHAAGDVVTKIQLRPNESRSFTAIWEIDDVVPLVNAELHAVARFVPSGASAMASVHIRPAF